MRFNWAYINPAAANPPDLSASVSGMVDSAGLGVQSITASAAGGTSPYSFSFSAVRPDGSTSTSEFSPATSSATTLFTPARVGLYTIQCIVTDSSTTTLTASNTQSRVVGTPLSVTISGLASTSSIAAQALVASGSNGTGGYTFSWNVLRPDNTVSTSEYSAPNAASTNFSVSLQGLNVLSCVATDSSGETASVTASATIGITGSDLAVTTTGLTAQDGLSPQSLSSTVVRGTPPYAYNWTTTRPDGSVSTAEISNTSIPNPVFTPLRVGMYSVTVQVTDSTPITALTASDTQSKFIGVELSGTISGLTSTQNTAVQHLTASATGGTGSYVYEWSVVRPTADISTSEFGGPNISGSEVTFTVGQAGHNVVRCQILDASDTKFTATASAQIGITGSDLSNVTTGFAARSDLNAQTLGSTVTGGIEPYTLSWTATRPDGTESTSEFNNTSASAPVFTPARVGLYSIQCTATDSSTPILTASSTQAKVVGTLLSVSITGISSSNLTHAQPVTASVVGGTGSPVFSYNSSNSVANGTTSDFSSPNTQTSLFTPSIFGLNTITVKVIDSSGATATATASVSLGVTGSDFSNTTAGLAATSSLAPQNLTSTLEGGLPSYVFAWSATRPDGSASTAEFNDATTQNPIFSPLRVGLYSVTCTATDSSTPALTASSTQAAFIGENLAVSITGIVNPNLSLTAQDLTASTSGGSGSYVYEWTSANATTSGSIANFSNFSVTPLSPSVTFTTTVVGLNVIAVKVTDETGVVTTATASTDIGVTGSDFTLTTAGLTAQDGLAPQSLTATPEGGLSSYSFSWIATNPDGTTSTSVFDNAATQNPVFSPVQTGLYSIQCTATDSTAPTALTASSTQAKFIGVELSSSITGLATTSSVAAQHLTASTGGGSGSYTFTWSVVKADGVVSQTEFSGFSASPLSQSAIFSASIQGLNVVQVEVIDDAGAKFVATASAFIGVTASAGGGDMSLTAGGLSSSATLLSIDLTANVNGGTAPLTFSWVATKPDGTTSTSEFSNAATQNPTFTPASVGLYSVNCTVTDNAAPALTASSAQAAFVGTELAVALTGTAGLALPTPSSSVALTAQRVTASIIGAGAGNESYSWSVIAPGDPNPSTSQFINFSNDPLSQSATFTPTVKGIHNLKCEVTDAQGTVVIASASIDCGTGLATPGEMLTVIPNVTYGTWTAVTGSGVPATPPLGQFDSDAGTGITTYRYEQRPSNDCKFPNKWVILESPVQTSFDFSTGGQLILQMDSQETTEKVNDVEEVFVFGVSSTTYNGNDASVDFAYIGQLGTANRTDSKVFYRLGAQNNAGSTQGTTDPLEGSVLYASVAMASGGIPQNIIATSWENDGTNTGYGSLTSTQVDFLDSGDVRFFVAIGGDSGGTSALPHTSSFRLQAGFVNTDLKNKVG
jgi:hypothetical protein